MKKTKIEWCDSTINPVVGCSRNCPYCYAKKINDRFHITPDFSKPVFFPERLKQLKNKKPRSIFMDSMSDVAFWTQEQMNITYRAIKENPQHTYIFLTKDFSKAADLLNNAWNETYTEPCETPKIFLGETFTKGDYDSGSFRPDFLSIEPIFGEVELPFGKDEGLCQIIIGAETGNRKGKVIPKKEWIDSLCKQADEFGIKVFMKDSLIPIVGEKNMRKELIWRSK